MFRVLNVDLNLLNPIVIYSCVCVRNVIAFLKDLDAFFHAEVVIQYKIPREYEANAKCY